MSDSTFPPRTTHAEIELGSVLRPKFGPDGLIPCITSDFQTNEVLMFSFMNEESLETTIKTGKATYWSRSRQKLWVKGEESGNTQLIHGLYVDCDQDVILLKVENVGGAACHNGYRSCFYRQLDPGADSTKPETLRLKFVGEKIFDPAKVYKK